VANLLTAIAAQPEWARHAPMLRTTAGHLGEMLGQPADRMRVDQLPSLVTSFKDYLQGRGYKRNAVRSYLHYLRLLIRAAGELGAKLVPSEIPIAWQAIYAAAKACKCGSVVRFAVESGIEPDAFGDEQLDRWAQAYMVSGHSYSRSIVVRHLFRKAIFDAGLNSVMPRLSRRQRSTYGIPVRQFPAALRAEVEAMMRFKQAEFVAEAKGKRTKLRPASARTVTQAVGRIYGYGRSHGHQINSLDDLVSRPVIAAFADFCINERKLRPDPVNCALGAVRAAYQQFRGVDLPWFRNLLMSMPTETAKTIVKRKAKKWVDYDELKEIPAKIRAAAERGRYSGKKLAIMRRNELLMTILTNLAWRQRNMREPTLGTRADGANIYKEQLHPLSTCARADWVLAALAADPHAKFWQVQFDDSETKAHKEIEMILPQDVSALLDEWVEVHRPLLVQGADPGTLFLNSKGRAMTQSRMTSTVGELTLRYAGRRVSPHIARDILIVGFLKDNPEQYELAAKILWHSTPTMIRQRYGANFDESFGAVAAERWQAKRKK
jgi:integrase